MDSLDHATCREWLSRELDGALTPAEQSRLEAYLAAHPELAEERRELARLDGLLAATRVAVRSGFRAEVLAALPAAGWEARHPRSWRLAAALLVLLGASAAALVGAGTARVEPEVPVVGALVAVADLFRSALLAGGGLLAASWKGVGLALGELLSGSLAGLLAFGLFVLFSNLLFFALLRGGLRSQPAASRRRGGIGGGHR